MNHTKTTPRYRFLVPVLLASFSLIVGLSAAGHGTQLVEFYETGCPHCARVHQFLQSIAADYPKLEIIRYEIHDPEGQRLLDRLLSAYNIELGTVPILFIGDVAMIEHTFFGIDTEPVVAMGRAAEMRLEEAIRSAIERDAPSPLEKAETVESKGLAGTLTIPALVIAAAADSVNPCSRWPSFRSRVRDQPFPASQKRWPPLATIVSFADAV